MSKVNNGIYEMAGGDIVVWIGEGGGICMKLDTKLGDPVELGEKEALDLADLLLKLVREQHE